MRILSLATIVVFALLTPLTAQVPARRPAFLAASVRPNTSDARLSSTPRFSTHLVMATNAPLLLLVTTAYGVRPDDVVGAPDWIERERFDVDARAGANSTPDQRRAMLQRLLEERFALRVHLDRREKPAFALSIAAADRTLGPNLRRSSVDCFTVACAGRISSGGVAAVGAPWTAVVGYLRAAVDERLVDGTQLTGRYDVTLQPASTDRDDIVAAIQQQLGLTLEPTLAPADVLVVDHVERVAAAN